MGAERPHAGSLSSQMAVSVLRCAPSRWAVPVSGVVVPLARPHRLSSPCPRSNGNPTRLSTSKRLQVKKARGMLGKKTPLLLVLEKTPVLLRKKARQPPRKRSPPGKRSPPRLDLQKSVSNDKPANVGPNRGVRCGAVRAVASPSWFHRISHSTPPVTARAPPATAKPPPALRRV